MTRRSKTTATILRGACLVLTLASAAAACTTKASDDDDGLARATDTEGDAGTGTGTTDGVTTSSPSTSSPSTSSPSTSSPSTSSPSTSSPSTSSPSTTNASDTMPDAGSGTIGPDCLASGEWVLVMLDREDPFGHFPFLEVFYDPAGPEQTAEETLQVEVAPDGTIGLSLLPRASGSGEGHAGLADLQGTIDESCEIAIEAQAPFTSDTGPFGTIDVTLEGTFTAFEPDGPAPSGTLTLEGGNIPNGPITYAFEITGQP